MGNVRLGGPRAFLVRRKLRRLSKDMVQTLIELERIDVLLQPQQIAHIRRMLVGALSCVELELRLDGATRRSMQTTYDQAVVTYNTTKELQRQFNHDMFVAQNGRIDVL